MVLKSPQKIRIIVTVPKLYCCRPARGAPSSRSFSRGIQFAAPSLLSSDRLESQVPERNLRYRPCKLLPSLAEGSNDGCIGTRPPCFSMRSDIPGVLDKFKANMATRPQRQEPPGWSKETLAIAAQARGMSGHKLEQLATRIQRYSGRSRETCWRLIIQYGLKGAWTIAGGPTRSLTLCARNWSGHPLRKLRGKSNARPRQSATCCEGIISVCARYAVTSS